MLVTILLGVCFASMKDVKADTEILTSSEVGLGGFQIRMANPGDELNVAFRVVGKAPKKGSSISVNGKQYIVKELGTIYTLDTNITGQAKNDKLSDKYTILDMTDYISLGWDYKYRGINTYMFGKNKVSPTFGYLAEKGIHPTWNASDTKNSYYIRTMEMMNDYVQNSIHVRTFVDAQYQENGETKTTLIYSDNIRSVSVAQIAWYFYSNSMANNKTEHDYLYNNILHNTELVSRKNNYYLSAPLEYGWNGTIVKP